jgi:hypothetical protein
MGAVAITSLVREVLSAIAVLSMGSVGRRMTIVPLVRGAEMLGETVFDGNRRKGGLIGENHDGFVIMMA